MASWHTRYEKIILGRICCASCADLLVGILDIGKYLTLLSEPFRLGISASKDLTLKKIYSYKNYLSSDDVCAVGFAYV